MINIKGKGNITINGRSYYGENITINGDMVTVDGVAQGELTSNDRDLIITGDLVSVESESGAITVNGNSNYVKTMSGEVTCGNVTGSVKTMSGAVRCERISGPVSTMSGAIIQK